MELCIWSDRVYEPLVREISTWATIKEVVTSRTKVILVLYSNDNSIYENTVRALSQKHHRVFVVANPTLNITIMNNLYDLAESLNTPFFFLDYKPFDCNIRCLHTGNFVKHIDIKTYYHDGPPIAHETFHNMSSVLDIMGERQFNYKGGRANVVQNRDMCNLTTMRCGAATCVLYSGFSNCGNIDIIHVYGDKDKEMYIHEMSNPGDCRSYYERYGVSIQMFLQNINVLDEKYHKERIKMIMLKFKPTTNNNRFR